MTASIPQSCADPKNTLNVADTQRFAAAHRPRRHLPVVKPGGADVFLKAYPPLFVTGVALCFGSLCGVHAIRRWPVPLACCSAAWSAWPVSTQPCSWRVSRRRRRSGESAELPLADLDRCCYRRSCSKVRLRGRHVVAALGVLVGAGLIVSGSRLKRMRYLARLRLWAAGAA